MGNQVKPVRCLLASIGHGWLHRVGHVLLPNAPCRTWGDARIRNPEIILKVALEWGNSGTRYLTLGSYLVSGIEKHHSYTPTWTEINYEVIIRILLFCIRSFKFEITSPISCDTWPDLIKKFRQRSLCRKKELYSNKVKTLLKLCYEQRMS